MWKELSWISYDCISDRSWQICWQCSYGYLHDILSTFPGLLCRPRSWNILDMLQTQITKQSLTAPWRPIQKLLILILAIIKQIKIIFSIELNPDSSSKLCAKYFNKYEIIKIFTHYCWFLCTCLPSCFLNSRSYPSSFCLYCCWFLWLGLSDQN